MANSSATLWIVAHQAPLSLGFPRQEYWRGLPFSLPGDLPDTGIESASPTLTSRVFNTEPPEKPIISHSVQFSSVAQSCPILCDPHRLQHARLPCPPPTPGVYSNSLALSQWCHPTISSSIVAFSSCLQSFPASGSFQMSQLFPSDDQSIGTSPSTSVLPMNIQDWFPFGWTGLISLQSMVLPRVFSNTTFQKHQFFSAQLSL